MPVDTKSRYVRFSERADFGVSIKTFLDSDTNFPRNASENATQS